MSGEPEPTVVELRRGESHPLDSAEGSFDLENAAHQLAGIPRWNAGTEPYINLATHLVGTSLILEEENAAVDTQFYGLTHDYPERVTGDMAHPLKYMLKDREIELDIDPERLDQDTLEENTDLPVKTGEAEPEELLEFIRSSAKLLEYVSRITWML